MNRVALRTTDCYLTTVLPYRLPLYHIVSLWGGIHIAPLGFHLKIYIAVNKEVCKDFLDIF